MSTSAPAIALLGCGHWGKNLARNFNQLGALHLVCDPGEAGRKTAKSIVPDVNVSEEFSDAFSDSTIEGVALATPAPTHHDLAIAAMEAGKDVYVEKPMALTVEEGLNMKACADANDRILMVGHILEYHPAIIRLKELIANNALGKIRHIYSNRLSLGKIRTEENVLWSFAPHDIAVMLRLIGKLPLRVSANGAGHITPGVADSTITTLNFSNDVNGHIFVSWLHPFKEQRLVVVGEIGTAVFDDVSQNEKLTLFRHNVISESGIPQLQKADAELIEIEKAEPLRDECIHFLECVKNRSEPLTNAESGISVLKVLEACQGSMINHGEPVTIS